MDYKEIAKMTVKQLREEAKAHTEITGTTGMKKDELVVALCGALKIEVPKKEDKAKSKERTKGAVRGDIKKMKDLRTKALESKDKKELKRARYHLKRLKRELRVLSVSA
ncbi:hypothetical protein ACFL2A_07490 [Thermodesulfobacteriota bacterium]